MKTIFTYKVAIALLAVVLLGLSATVTAQTNYYFYVQLKNKNNTTYSLSNPSAYLSQRSIDRRTAFNVALDSTDLPVNTAYIKQIENLGAHVHCASKWMNGVTVKLTDSTKMSQVRALPYVKSVQYTGLQVGALLTPSVKNNSKAAFNYGIAAGQINQLNGAQLHNEGYRGKGIQVAVIDAGFTNVNTNVCFDSLRLQGRLLGTKDVINPTSNIFSEDNHGAMVLSSMTGNMPGQYLGTAPDASYWLIRTEYSPTEYKVETDFWCSGIEFADSVGVDIATSSLGYSTFDDSRMDFSYADMNGKVSRASRAATIASQKGMVVLVAAGNEGDVTNSWHYISSPSDAEGIITVGSVTSTGTPSSFSSYGPSSDGRVKPEICATGSSSALVSTGGTLTYNSGTSFATPIMAGMMACLLQKYKSQNQYPSISTLIQSVIKTGNHFNSPTAQMGYGIPDFKVAEQNLSVLNMLRQIYSSSFILAYNSGDKSISIDFVDISALKQSSVRIYSLTGELLLNQALTNLSTRLNTENFSTGIYAVCVIENGKTETRKIIISK
ncbi:MAG: S8 family serine peptidase [Paludibacter sp.]